jgi:hypothetical protein
VILGKYLKVGIGQHLWIGNSGMARQKFGGGVHPAIEHAPMDPAKAFGHLTRLLIHDAFYLVLFNPSRPPFNPSPTPLRFSMISAVHTQSGSMCTPFGIMQTKRSLAIQPNPTKPHYEHNDGWEEAKVPWMGETTSRTGQ